MYHKSVAGLLLLGAVHEAVAFPQQAPSTNMAGMTGMDGTGMDLAGGGFSVSNGGGAQGQAGSPNAGLGLGGSSFELSPSGAGGTAGAPGAGAASAGGAAPPAGMSFGAPSSSFDVSNGVAAGYPQGAGGAAGGLPSGAAGGLPAAYPGGDITLGGLGGLGGAGAGLGGAGASGAGGLGGASGYPASAAGGFPGSSAGGDPSGAAGLDLGGLGGLGGLGQGAAGGTGGAGQGLSLGGSGFGIDPSTGAGGSAQPPAAWIAAQQEKLKNLSPVILDLPIDATANNLAIAQWPALQAAFTTPNLTAEVTTGGWDWTSKYPSQNLQGFGTHLRVAYGVPVTTKTANTTTDISSLTFSLPQAMSNTDGTSKPMDPSWYVCQHIFVSNKAADLGNECGGLSPQCLADLRNQTTSKWATLADTPCGAEPGTEIPASCVDTFGSTKSQVIDTTADFVNNKAQNGHWGEDKQDKLGFYLGTGAHAAGDQAGITAAQSRTYMVATVYGPSLAVDASVKKPADVILSCVAAKPVVKAVIASSNTTISGNGTTNSTAPKKTSGASRSVDVRPTLALALVGALSYMLFL